MDGDRVGRDEEAVSHCYSPPLLVLPVPIVPATVSVMMRVVEGGPQWNFLSTPVGQWISRPRTSSRVRGPQTTWRQLSSGTVPVLSVALIESLTSA